MSILDTFTPLGWVKLAAGGAVIALVASSMLMMHSHNLSLRAELAQEKAARASDRAEVATRDRKAISDAAADRLRADAQRKKADDEAQSKLDAAVADADRARTAGDRLRSRYAAAIAADRARPDRDAAVAGSAPASAADMPDLVFGRVVGAARQYAEAAELAIVRGKRCEAEYDALMPSTITLPPMKLSAP